MAKIKRGSSTQIKITRTAGEWDLIIKKLCPEGREDLTLISRHIRREVLKIKNRLKEIPESVTWMGGEAVDKRPYIDNAILEDIAWIALKMHVKPSVVIDRLIITPLLQPQP